MSRGLYQLSYGSSSGKYAPILPVWQEKNHGFSRKYSPAVLFSSRHMPFRQGAISPAALPKRCILRMPGAACSSGRFINLPHAHAENVKKASPLFRKKGGQVSCILFRPVKPLLSGTGRSKETPRKVSHIRTGAPSLCGRNEGGAVRKYGTLCRRPAYLPVVDHYRAWKYSRGCAQAGQDSGASRPSCT